MRLPRRLGLGAIAVGLLASPSVAIVSNPLPRICNEYPHSDYVFSGRVLTESDIWPRRLHGEGVMIYRIRADRIFKGKVPRIARLQTRNDSARGDLSVGQHAILFAYRQDGRMAFDGSSNSQSGSGVSKVIAELRTYLVRPPKVATISGRIDGWFNGPLAPLRGARLLITDGRKKRFVRADQRGTFFASVTPGRWSVQIAERGWASRTGVYSYDSAERTQLARGGCADFQIGVKLQGKPQWKRWPR